MQTKIILKKSITLKGTEPFSSDMCYANLYINSSHSVPDIYNNPAYRYGIDLNGIRIQWPNIDKGDILSVAIAISKPSTDGFWLKQRRRFYKWFSKYV
jgi:hypothetical protein